METRRCCARRRTERAASTSTNGTKVWGTAETQPSAASMTSKVRFKALGPTASEVTYLSLNYVTNAKACSKKLGSNFNTSTSRLKPESQTWFLIFGLWTVQHPPPILNTEKCSSSTFRKCLKINKMKSFYSRIKILTLKSSWAIHRTIRTWKTNCRRQTTLGWAPRGSVHPYHASPTIPTILQDLTIKTM